MEKNTPAESSQSFILSGIESIDMDNTGMEKDAAETDMEKET